MLSEPVLGHDKVVLRHRPEIDGLRSVAVIPVLLFHAGFSAFSGGFVGVDVFFVISGYLITGIIARELSDHTFSMRKFYERRARRILPALYLVVVASMVVAWFVLSPWQLTSFMRSVLAVSVFSANIFFWRSTDYFAQVAEESPLLHTWSLSVEEQFYVAFPFLLAFLWKRGPRVTTWVLVICAVLSLALSEWSWRHHPVPNFYLAPGRAWELLAGSLLAIAPYRSTGPALVTSWARECGAFLGMAMLVASIVFFDTDTPFPSVWALLPVLGTVLVIACADSTNLVGRLLSTRLLVGIGLISYSLYLWHQPVFAFARAVSIEPPTAMQFGGLLALSVVLAVGSWRFIETPVRNRARIPARRLFQFSLGSTLALILIGATGFRSQMLSGSVAFPPLLIQSFEQSPRRAECFDIPHAHDRATGWSCGLGAKSADSTTSFFAYGDSHALAMMPAFDQIATGRAIRGEFAAFSECAPLLETVMIRRKGQDERNCAGLGQRVLRHAQQQHIPMVVIVGRWTYYTDGDYGGRGLNFIGAARGDEASQARSRVVFREALERTIAAYAQAGIRLVLVEQIPMQRYAPKSTYFKALKSGAIDRTLVSLSVMVADHHRLQSFVTLAFDPYRSDPRVRIVNVESALCDSRICRVGSSAESYYSDDDHLSVVGAKHVAATLDAAVFGTAQR
jgi:peptidoglycan/LPS O-acetylase OafA/YrhL